LRYRLIVHNILWSIWNLQAQAQVGGLARLAAGDRGASVSVDAGTER
jgi:hypothetical protein